MDFRDIKEFFNDAFKYIILIVVVFVVAVYILSFQQVVGNSMEPTFSSGDVVLINKLFPTFFDIDRNDVIVLVEDSSYLIKRVIGLPGEYIKYEDNKLY
ncbi:MAG: signal peptidase I, partial [Mycoplasmatota bacterium]